MAALLPYVLPPRRKISRVELVAWIAVAALTGLVLSLLDKPAREFESGLLVFMIAGFWLALPGRAPVTWLAIACGLGPLLGHYFSAQFAHDNTLLPAIIAVLGGAMVGRFAGRQL